MEQGHRIGEASTMCPWLGLLHPPLKFFPPGLTAIVDTLIPLTSDFKLLPLD